jgi:Ca2+-binding RTX toxin-like protein
MFINLRNAAQAAAAERFGDFISATGSGAVDVIIGSASEQNALYGGALGDLIIGGSRGDDLHGEGIAFPALSPLPPVSEELRGPDTILGFAGHDSIHGEWGDDILDGGTGNDSLFAGEGNDFARGGKGHDVLYGDGGNDLLFGGTGNDTLSGGLGNDHLTGGTGADRFVVNAAFDGSPAAGRDIITDFRPGIDVIDLLALNHPSMWYGESLDEAFVFRGQSTLVDYPEGEVGAKPGQLRFEFRGDTTVVQLDVAHVAISTGHATSSWADGAVDAEIVLFGRHELTSADFFL